MTGSEGEKSDPKGETEAYIEAVAEEGSESSQVSRADGLGKGRHL